MSKEPKSNHSKIDYYLGWWLSNATREDLEQAAYDNMYDTLMEHSQGVIDAHYEQAREHEQARITLNEGYDKDWYDFFNHPQKDT